MALPGSGIISMNDIRVELGIPSQAPFNIDDARKGVYVPINACSTNKPPSTGTVSLSSWYGYNHTATCGCDTTYYLPLPTSNPDRIGFYEYVTTAPITLGSHGNLTATLNFSLVVNGYADVFVNIEYYDSTYNDWLSLSCYTRTISGSSGDYISYGTVYNERFSGNNTFTKTLTFTFGSYPTSLTSIRFGVALSKNDYFGQPPTVVYFSTQPSVYISCPSLESCGSSSPSLSFYSYFGVTCRWISLGGFYTGTVSVPWSFTPDTDVSDALIQVWYNGSKVGDTGNLSTSSSGTITFSVNGSDNKYCVVFYNTTPA